MESYLSYIHSICDRIYGILIEIDPPNHHALYQTRNTSSAPFPILLYPTDFQNIFHQHNYKALFQLATCKLFLSGYMEKNAQCVETFEQQFSDFCDFYFLGYATRPLMILD